MLETDAPIGKMFPIQDDEIKEIPWHLLNEEYAWKNHRQSLSYLAHHGGLNIVEAWANIKRATCQKGMIIFTIKLTEEGITSARNYIRQLQSIKNLEKSIYE